MRIFGALLLVSICASAQPGEYNSLYAGDSEVFTREPNALLVEAVRNRKPGRALDVGMGQGRNALFLSRNGWEVTGIDSADDWGVPGDLVAAERTIGGVGSVP